MRLRRGVIAINWAALAALAPGPGVSVLTWTSGETDNRPDFSHAIPSNNGAPTDAVPGDDDVVQIRDLPDGEFVEYYRNTLGDPVNSPTTITGVDALTDGPKKARGRVERADAELPDWSAEIDVLIDTTAPTLSSPAGAATGQTTADLSVTTNEANGTLYVVLTESVTPPTQQQVIDGEDDNGDPAAFDDSQAIASTGSKTFNATSLTEATEYWPYFVHVDAYGNTSTVSAGSSFTTNSSGFVPTDLGADLVLWLEADDLTTLFQNIAGSSAVTTDGQTVGTWNDKSGDNFHLTAPGDDTTRPVYNTAGGLHWVTFDGSNDVLRRDADIGMYAAGACSVFVAYRGTAATSRTLVGSSSGSATAPAYLIQAGNPDSDDLQEFVRNDANTTLSARQVFANGAINSADHVIGFTDSAGSMVMYLDGTQVDTGTYAPSAATFNRFGLGSFVRAPGAANSQFWNGRIYAVVIVNRVIDAGERASLTTYLGAKAGLTL